MVDIAQNEYVFDVSERDFAEKVIQPSMTTPVIVDFWAPWCGPCKQLGPMLEKAVNAQDGRVLMAKVNIDTSKMLAGQLRIQSVPTVYGFYQGQPIDGFQGAVPESEIIQFINRLLEASGGAGGDDMQSHIDTLNELLADGHNEDALMMAQELYHNVPDNEDIIKILLQAYMANGKLEEAMGVIENLSDAQKKWPEVAQIQASEKIMSKASHFDINRLQAAIKNDENDYFSYHDYALALAAKGRFEEAMDHLLHIIKHDREWENNKARQSLLELFDALGASDPLTLKKRRNLSSILFS